MGTRMYTLGTRKPSQPVKRAPGYGPGGKERLEHGSRNPSPGPDSVAGHTKSSHEGNSTAQEFYTVIHAGLSHCPRCEQYKKNARSQTTNHDAGAYTSRNREPRTKIIPF